MTPPKNMSASVRQRLLNRAKRDRRPFNELLQYYAMERFLYRLSQSAHAERFVLKGALMLKAWRSPELRPTMDIDMLGRTSNEEVDIVVQIRDILTTDVAPKNANLKQNEVDSPAYWHFSISSKTTSIRSFPIHVTHLCCGNCSDLR